MTDSRTLALFGGATLAYCAEYYGNSDVLRRPDGSVTPTVTESSSCKPQSADLAALFLTARAQAAACIHRLLHLEGDPCLGSTTELVNRFGTSNLASAPSRFVLDRMRWFAWGRLHDRRTCHTSRDALCHDQVGACPCPRHVLTGVTSNAKVHQTMATLATLGRRDDPFPEAIRRSV